MSLLPCNYTVFLKYLTRSPVRLLKKMISWKMRAKPCFYWIIPFFFISVWRAEFVSSSIVFTGTEFTSLSKLRNISNTSKWRDISSNFFSCFVSVFVFFCFFFQFFFFFKELSIKSWETGKVLASFKPLEHPRTLIMVSSKSFMLDLVAEVFVIM